MNNNRGGNNRRRGRGNNNPRPPGAGAAQQVNRIDSRARGNAPQMLEKYRKLANDAHLNGDRVNAEYYLQFADHYFRVIADTRVRQEEQRLRRDDRWQDGDGGSDEGDDAGEFSAESEFPAFDQPPVYTRRDREDRPERPERPSERVPERGQDRPQPPYRRQDERPVQDRATSDAEPNQRQAGPGQQPPAVSDGTGPDAAEGVTSYEPPENPFLRENRGGRGLRPRREDRRPRREDGSETSAAPQTPAQLAANPDSDRPDMDRSARAISAGIDPDSLPPSFTAARNVPESGATAITGATTGEEALAPAPRRRARRKPAADDAGEPIQSLI